MRRRERGLSIPMVLIVLTIIITIVFAVAAQGNWNSYFVTKSRLDKEAFFAAEAGISESLAKYKRGDNDWRNGVGSSTLPLTLANGISYYVQVTDNQEGLTSITAPNGTEVPPGLAYFLATGIAFGGKSTKEVGVMVKGAFMGKFNYALAATGDIDLKAGTDIYGNVKANGDIIFEAQVDVKPVKAEGNVYAGGKIMANAIVDMDTGQYARTRDTFTNGDKIKDAIKIDHDTSYYTLPFNTLKETTINPNPTVDGENLPYPNISTLFAGGYTTHQETHVNGTFDLGNGEIQYFPNGVTFNSSTNFTGSGTIVVGNNNPIVFETPIGSNSNFYKMNIVAIDGPDSTGPGANIFFKNSVFINGLIYAYGKIETQATVNVKGNVISYQGDVVHSGASADFQIYPIETYTPGFEAWLGDGSGTSSVNIVSWQKY